MKATLFVAVMNFNGLLCVIKQSLHMLCHGQSWSPIRPANLILNNKVTSVFLSQPTLEHGLFVDILAKCLARLQNGLANYFSRKTIPSNCNTFILILNFNRKAANEQLLNRMIHNFYGYSIHSLSS